MIMTWQFIVDYRSEKKYTEQSFELYFDDSAENYSTKSIELRDLRIQLADLHISICNNLSKGSSTFLSK